MGTSIYSYAKGLYVSVVSPPCHISLRPQRMKDFASSRIRVRPTLVGIVIKTRTNNRQQQQHKNSTKKKELVKIDFSIIYTRYNLFVVLPRVAMHQWNDVF